MLLQNFFRPSRPKPSRLKSSTLNKKVIRTAEVFRSAGGGLILILAGLALYFFLRSDIFLVRQIQTYSQMKYLLSEEQVSATLSKYLAHSILVINTSEIVDLIHRTYPEVNEISVIKQLPETLVVNYAEFKPVLILQYQGSSYLVAKTGFVFAQDPKVMLEDVPQVTLIESVLPLGDGGLLQQNLSASMVDWWIEIAVTEWTVPQLREIKVHDSYIELGFESLMAYITSGKSVIEQRDMLKLIVDNARSEQKVVELVDLRFKNPVVRYKKS